MVDPKLIRQAMDASVERLIERDAERAKSLGLSLETAHRLARFIAELSTFTARGVCEIVPDKDKFLAGRYVLESVLDMMENARRDQEAYGQPASLKYSLEQLADARKAQS